MDRSHKSSYSLNLEISVETKGSLCDCFFCLIMLKISKITVETSWIQPKLCQNWTRKVRISSKGRILGRKTMLLPSQNHKNSLYLYYLRVPYLPITSIRVPNLRNIASHAHRSLQSYYFLIYQHTYHWVIPLSSFAVYFLPFFLDLNPRIIALFSNLGKKRVMLCRLVSSPKN